MSIKHKRKSYKYYSELLTRELLLDLYETQKLTAIEISNKLDICELTIRQYLKRHGISRRTRKYSPNHDFFKTWSHEMAYILGFLITDGTIVSSNGHMCLSWSIHPRDIEILEYIQTYLCPEIPIRTYSGFSKTHQKEYIISNYTCHSKEMINDLNKLYGILPNKTGSEDVNFDIPEEFFGDFLRGVFDGDGSVTTKSKAKLLTRICCSSKPFLYKLRDISGGIGRIHKYGIYTWNMSYKDSLRFKNIVYSSYNDFGLKRKKDILFERILE